MQGRMSGVQGFDWTKFLGREHLAVLNDAHAALLGETWLGAAAGAKNVVMLTLGTGVGGAIMCDGKLIKGQLGRAGHLGHISLDPEGPLDIVNTPGSLEDAFGDHTVSVRSGGRFDTTEALLRAHLGGDIEATAIWDRSVKTLAAGMVSMINAVDPEIIVIGGGIASAGPALFNPLSRWLDQFEWRPHGAKVRIVPAALGDRAGAMGAARYAMEMIR
jgi:glucokinase